MLLAQGRFRYGRGNFKGISNIDFGWMPIGFYSTLPQQQDLYRLRSTPIPQKFRESSSHLLQIANVASVAFHQWGFGGRGGRHVPSGEFEESGEAGLWIVATGMLDEGEVTGEQRGADGREGVCGAGVVVEGLLAEQPVDGAGGDLCDEASGRASWR